MNDRLYRSRSDRMLAGVAGGLAERFDLDPSIVRVGWAILTILSGGIFLLIYIVMAIVVPEEPASADRAAWSDVGTSWGSGWTSAWPASTGAPADPAPSPPAPSQPAPPDASATGAAATAPTATAPTDPGTPVAPSGAGFAAPIAGGWTPPAPANPPPSSDWPAGAGLSRHDARQARRAARRAARGDDSDRPGAGGLVGGLVLVLLGIYFLVRTFAPQVEIYRFWPAGLVLIGVILVGLSIRRTPGSPTP